MELTMAGERDVEAGDESDLFGRSTGLPVSGSLMTILAVVRVGRTKFVVGPGLFRPWLA